MYPLLTEHGAEMFALMETYPRVSWQVFLEGWHFIERKSLGIGHLIRGRRGNLLFRELKHIFTGIHTIGSAKKELMDRDMPTVENCNLIFPIKVLCDKASKELADWEGVGAVGTTALDIEITAAGISKGSTFAEFVDKIVIHAPDKASGHRTQQIDVYYNFVGEIEASCEIAKRETA